MMLVWRRITLPLYFVALIPLSSAAANPLTAEQWEQLPASFKSYYVLGVMDAISVVAHNAEEVSRERNARDFIQDLNDCLELQRPRATTLGSRALDLLKQQPDGMKGLAADAVIGAIFYDCPPTSENKSRAR